jgi:putative ABC transport system permease protein
VITGIAFALVPALRASRFDLASSLKQGTRGAGWRQSRLQRGLAAGQVAVSFLLLMGAGLLLHSMRNILSADPGFETRNILLASVDLDFQRISPARGLAFYREVLQRLRAEPGVIAAGAATSTPPDEWPGAVSIFHPGQEPPQDVLRGHEFQLGLRVNFASVSPGYFKSLGVRLLQGRDFTDRDGESQRARDQDGNFVGATDRAAGAAGPVGATGGDAASSGASVPGVVIINQKLAQRLWPGENPIGKRISWPTVVGPPRAPLEVIGVVADVKYLSLVRDAPLLMYVPLTENYSGRATFIVRTVSSPADFSAVLRRGVSSVDKSLPVFGVQTMPEHLALSLWQQRMAASLISAFGLLALLLATLGLYSVVAQSVAQRTREIGVRMALGASREGILRLVLTQGMALALAGVAAGLIAGLALPRLLSGLLFGVSTLDPWTLISASITLVLVTLLACYVPARRAAKVDPMVALRYEYPAPH